MGKQIRQNRNQSNRNRPKNNTNKKPRSNIRGRGTVKAKGVIKKQISKAKIQDARQKIIQKKRTVVHDARDVLAQKAKTKDARSKIENIRSHKNGTQLNNSNIKVIGTNILRKTDRNGKISLVTNKSLSTTNKNKPGSTHSNMNLAIKKQLGLLPNTRGGTIKKTPPKRAGPQQPIRRSSAPIRKTILNDFENAQRLYNSDSVYKWTRPELRPASEMINSLETTRQAMREVMREELMASSRWAEYVSPKPARGPVSSNSYANLDITADEEMPLATPSRISLQGSTRISNVHSRLDRLPTQTETHGILAQTKTKVVVPAGHRIVVSNLQNTVTQDDIKELFEDIGQLLTARLVRPGVAEVIYKNLKDAQKAVDTYHNRQLDGQPMKCLLVNKRPANQLTSPQLSKESVMSIRKPVTVSSSSNTLVPDIGTIHKVLFQRKY